jgi:hypothetical protein
MKSPSNTSVGIFAVVFCATMIACGGGGAGGGGTTTTTTSTTTTATTTTSTTATTTTSTTSTTTGTTAGFLPQNSILFVSNDGPSKLRSIKEDGTGDTTVASFNFLEIGAVAKNPNSTNNFAFAQITVSGTSSTMRLYSGDSSLNPATSTPLASTVFDSINDIQFTQNGARVLFTGIRASDTNPKLFSVPATGGAVTVLDDADDFNISPIQSSNLVAYSKETTAGVTELFTLNYATAGSITQITSRGTLSNSASWNRAGTSLLFSSLDGTSGRNEIWRVNATGGSPTRITNTSDVSEFGAMFNQDATKISFVGLNSDPLKTGLYVMNADGSSPVLLVASTSLLNETYFTDANGRSLIGLGWHFSSNRSFRRGRR